MSTKTIAALCLTLLGCASAEIRGHYRQLDDPEKKKNYYFCITSEEFSREDCFKEAKKGKQFPPKYYRNEEVSSYQK